MTADCRPLRRRSVSEVQLMHSVSVRKHIQQRQEWLQERMQGIHTAPLHDGKISSSERITLERTRSQDFTHGALNGDVAETQ
ncbi:parathyroid hormone 1a [Tachysurus ichikawai]